MAWTLLTPGSSEALYSFLVAALYQSRIRPTKGEMRKAPASAAAMAWTSENMRVRLVLMPYLLCRISAALIPSQVEAILIRMRSLEIPCSLYSWKTVSTQKKRNIWGSTYIDDAQRFFDRGLGVEGEAGIDLSRDLSGDELEDFLAELDKEVVEGGIDLVIDAAALGLAVGNGSVDERGVVGLLRSSEDQGGVGGGILGVVLGDGGEVTGVADNGL